MYHFFFPTEATSSAKLHLLLETRKLSDSSSISRSCVVLPLMSAQIKWSAQSLWSQKQNILGAPHHFVLSNRTDLLRHYSLMVQTAIFSLSQVCSPAATIIHVSGNTRPQGVALQIICSKLALWALVLKLHCFILFFVFFPKWGCSNTACLLPVTARKLSFLWGLWQDCLQASATLLTAADGCSYQMLLGLGCVRPWCHKALKGLLPSLYMLKCSGAAS